MYDVAVIGAGIVGAACAYELSKYNLRVAVLEKKNDVCCGTTKANSAIIHAGYDPLPGTLMARLNVAGSKMAGELCKKLDVPYQQIGSLVVAFSEDDKKRGRGTLSPRNRKRRGGAADRRRRRTQKNGAVYL